MLSLLYYHTRNAHGEPEVFETHTTDFGGLDIVITVHCEHAPGRGIFPYMIAIPRLSSRDLEGCTDSYLLNRLRNNCAILELEVEENFHWTVQACSLIRASCPAGFLPYLTPCTLLEGEYERLHEPVYFTGRYHGDGNSPAF